MKPYIRTLAIAALLVVWRAAVAGESLRLDDTGVLTPVSLEDDKFLLAVSEAKKLVTAGDARAVKAAYDKLKQDYPSLAGVDYDLFVEGEVQFARGKFTPAVRAYDKILNEHRKSPLYEAALDREFQIATGFLEGRKKSVLLVFKLRGYDEGIKMMDKIAERASDTPLALRANIAVAEHYERRQMFNDAHLRWAQIDAEWGAGPVGKDALLAMARNKHAAYNVKPVVERPLYDGAPLVSSRSYYTRFSRIYPEDADRLAVDETIVEIDEQIAFKQYVTAQYYIKADKVQAANLYFDMIVRQWPKTRAAQLARRVLAGEVVDENEDEG